MPSIFEDDGNGVRAVVKALVTALAALPVKTAETMAKETHKTLCELSKAEGQNPDREIFIRKPGEPRHFADELCWVVAWELGPWEWAIPASMAIGSATGKLTEPYYSFDLCFYPGEDDA